MAHLWRLDGRAWREHALAAAPTILRTDVAAGAGWVLVAPADARLAVNGEPVRLGFVVLRDRDEITLASGERAYFSTEEAPVVAPLVAPAPGLRCARCQRPVVAGETVVRCPGDGCGLVHHETDELPCWTYDLRCAVCPQTTAFDPAERWTPEEL